MHYSPPTITPDVTICCPECKRPANFSFVTNVLIQVEDRDYFEKSRNFEVVRGQHSHGGYYTAAVYFHGLGNSLENIKDLPNGYSADMWRPKYRHVDLLDKFRNMGAYRCADCGVQKKYTISWPKDAYFQLDYKGQTLWAYDRKTALKLLDYIESKERNKTITGHVTGKPHIKITSQDSFLRKIPEHFQTAKARQDISRKLRKILSAC